MRDGSGCGGETVARAAASVVRRRRARAGRCRPTILFGGKDTDLTTVGADIAKNYKLSGVFAPLEALFTEFTGLIAVAPHDDVTVALNDVRVGLTTGLSALDPANVVSALRAIQARLAAVTPSAMLPLPDALSGLPALVDTALGNAVPGHEAQAAKLRADVAKLALWVKPADPASPLQSSIPRIRPW